MPLYFLLPQTQTEYKRKTRLRHGLRIFSFHFDRPFLQPATPIRTPRAVPSRFGPVGVNKITPKIITIWTLTIYMFNIKIQFVPDGEHDVESSWNVMAHGDAREAKWRGNRRMQWVASTLHTTSEHVVSSITTADPHTSAASIRLNWRPPADLNGLVLFARKTKSGFCACAITFQLAPTAVRNRIRCRMGWLMLVNVTITHTGGKCTT